VEEDFCGRGRQGKPKGSDSGDRSLIGRGGGRKGWKKVGKEI